MQAGNAERVRITVLGVDCSIVSYIHAGLYAAWNTVLLPSSQKNLWNLGIFKVQSKNERYNCEKPAPFISLDESKSNSVQVWMCCRDSGE